MNKMDEAVSIFTLTQPLCPGSYSDGFQIAVATHARTLGVANDLNGPSSCTSPSPLASKYCGTHTHALARARAHTCESPPRRERCIEMRCGETFDERGMYCLDDCERFGRIFTKASLDLSASSESNLKAFSVQELACHMPALHCAQMWQCSYSLKLS